MTDPAIPTRGDRVEARLYHSDNEWVTGTYRPREDFPDAAPPADAAWVDTGDPQGAAMVDVASIRPVREDTVRPELRAIRDAAQAMADAVRAALATNLSGARLPLLPQIPHLQVPRLVAPSVVVEEAPPDPRQLAVTVRAVPVLGESSERHTYRDPGGLTWQTYGAHDDFGTDRLLEVQNTEGDVIASYQPGTWLHACYGAYLELADGETS